MTIHDRPIHRISSEAAEAVALVGLPAAPAAPRHIAISSAAFDRLTTTQAAALREHIRAVVEWFLREVQDAE